MIAIGDFAELEVVKKVDFGIYLDGGPLGEILLPLKEVPEGTEPGQDLNVFLYCDSEDRVIATTQKPYAKAGDLVGLKVVDTTDFGAFLDWGLLKDLFVPFAEQHKPMQKGKTYVVRVLVDETSGRMVASSRLNRFIAATANAYVEGDAVEILVAEVSDLGYRVIVDDRYWGALYSNEIFKPIAIGDRLKAYIKRVREDQKLDISLQAPGYKHVGPASEQLLQKLKQEDGFLALTDKSPPERIYHVMQMSKKTFKKAVGQLYRERKIRLKADGIYLVPVEER